MYEKYTNNVYGKITLETLIQLKVINCVNSNLITSILTYYFSHNVNIICKNKIINIMITN